MTQWPTYPEAGGLVSASGEAFPVEAGQTPQTSADLAEWYASKGLTRDNPVIYAAGGDTLRKTGEWVVPAFIKIRGGLGSVILDMQRATASAAMISVEIAGGLGEITIITPEGWSADISAITPGFGTRKCKVSEQPIPGFPFLYATGSLALGTFTIRYPKPRDVRRMEREIKAEQHRRSRSLR